LQLKIFVIDILREVNGVSTECIKIDSLGDYINNILTLSQNLKRDLRYDETLFYRGQEDIKYDLLPSLARPAKNFSSNSLILFERDLIESAQNKFPSIFYNRQTPINLLAHLQHYGIPTRLLDVTMNPLVALHFACKNENTDGEVIVFKDSNNSSVTYPIINSIADSYRLAPTSIEYLSCFYEKAIEQPYFIEQKTMLKNTFEDDFEKGGLWVEECCQKLLFVNALELSERQKFQQGRYILFHNRIASDENNKYFRDEIKKIEKNSEFVEKKYTIPKANKTILIKQLSALGITESALFADNIDLVCKEIATRQKERLTDDD
jgi:hypothetical protein